MNIRGWLWKKVRFGVTAGVYTKSEPGAVATGSFRGADLPRSSKIVLKEAIETCANPVATAPGSDFV